MYDLANQQFGRLTAISSSPGKNTKERVWECQCVCGNRTEVRSYCLRKGITKSCGCLRTEAIASVDNTIHGYYNTPTYHTWEGMKQRCLNPQATRYPAYGAVGVKVCDRWLEFSNFLEEMGQRPDNKTLDRIDPYGNYEPSNCRWATRKEQQNNQRRHKVLAGEVCPNDCFL